MEKEFNAVTVEIIGNLLLSVAEEVGIAIVKSSYSTNIKERRDISTAVFDPEGNLIAQAEYVAMHLGSLLTNIKQIYEKYPMADIRPGDMFISNDPYNGGGTHLSDIAIAAPVFGGGKIIGWISNIAHHSDIGGKVPGSIPGDAISIFEEGIRIPIVKICENDVPDSRIVEFIMNNSRSPKERYGDLQAQIAGNRVGRQRMEDAFERWGDVMVKSMYALEDYTERRLRSGIRSLKEGEYAFEDFMDPSPAFGDKPGRIAVKIKVMEDSMHFDFAGTHEQILAPINLTYNGLLACVFYCMKTLIDPDVPSNIGIMRTFTIDAAPGLLVNCTNPSPVGERIDSAMRVVDVIFGALAPAVGMRAMAGCNSTCTSAIFYGDDPRNENAGGLIYLETIGGGSGAYRDMDGLSGVQVHMTNTSNLPIEALEMEFPLLMVRSYALATDSGGVGEYRGGLGIERIYEILHDNVSCTALADRQAIPPWGLEGGANGAGGQYRLQRNGEEAVRLGSKVTNIILNKGDVFEIRTPGAGGFGNPMTRPAAMVLEDITENRITPAEASKYGVVLSTEADGLHIDKERTDAARRLN